MNYRLCTALCFFLLPFHILFGQNSAFFREGENLFRLNKFDEAIIKLEQASAESGANPLVFNYLGLCYQEKGRYQESLDTFARGIAIPGSNKKLLYYNSGNTAFMMGNYPDAEKFYTLSVSADSRYAPAFLNRGNARIREDNLTGASADYERYLDLMPDSPQRDKILSTQSLIAAELKSREDEKARLAMEEALIAVEQKRIADEKERVVQEERKQAEIKAASEAAAVAAREAEKAEQVRVEAEKRQKLLSDIASSLQSADESTNLSAGTEGVMGYEYESELE